MIDSTDPTWYAARDANSPADLAAIYGEVNVAWMPVNTAHYQRMLTGLPYSQRFGWATYLENARIRELTQGEGSETQRIHQVNKTTVTVNKADLAAVLAEAPRTEAWQRLTDALLKPGNDDTLNVAPECGVTR